MQTIPAEDLVPSDVVQIAEGDVATADLRLIEAAKLQIDESALTGESLPISKSTAALAEETELAERTNMLFRGTAVTRGSGAGVVVATGMDTELGTISELATEAEGTITPLEKRLHRLGQRLVWVVIGLAAVVAVAGIIAGQDVLRIVETAIALAVAAVPEGLPIVATVALARGMWRWRRHNALVEQPSAVETLGSTTAVFVDKTGTLTENQMTVTQIRLADRNIAVSGEGLRTEGEFSANDETVDPKEDDRLRTALEVGVLCNSAEPPAEPANGEGENDSNAHSDDGGEPLEVALLVAGAKADMRRADLLETYPEARKVPFDPDVNMMATFHEQDDSYRVAVKGSPEAVLAACTRVRTAAGATDLDEEGKERWRTYNEEMAADGLRLIALATKEVDSSDADPYEALTLLGLVGLLDPPRAEVRDAIQASQEAGIQIVMVTGDHPETVRNVGAALGIPNDDVIRGSDLASADDLSRDEKERVLRADIFARVTPEQKLKLIDLYQDNGAIVAMTGDGVNDAPALQKADIGVAMGRRGTQVAQEAADVVLQNDSFSTIEVAIEYGRIIFENIRKFTVYLISGNVGEIAAVTVATLTPLPLPLLPLQILYINVVNDVFPSLALGVGGSQPGIMQRPPRHPDEPILRRSHWNAIVIYGLIIGATVLGALFLAIHWLGMDRTQAVTVSFVTVVTARLWHVFNMRSQESGILRNEVTRNPFVWGALALCIVLLLLAIYFPPFASVLNVVDPGVQGWLVILGMSLVPLMVGQILKFGDADEM